jgi:hypothetical protein
VFFFFFEAREDQPTDSSLALTLRQQPTHPFIFASGTVLSHLVMRADMSPTIRAIGDHYIHNVVNGHHTTDATSHRSRLALSKAIPPTI